MERHGRVSVASVVVLGLAVGSASAQVTERVSVASDEAQGNGNTLTVSISADGRYVAFESPATTLVAGDTNGVWDIFVRDRQTGTTERVSLTSAEAQAGADSYRPSISADGRYVAFYSLASNLVPGDVNGSFDVFVRDRQLGTTVIASVDSSEVQGVSESIYPRISADGRYVAFYSTAGNLVAGDVNGLYDVFVRDLAGGTTECASVALGGASGNHVSVNPVISADGRYVAFASMSSNLVAADGNGVEDVFLHDRQTGTTDRVSVATGGAEATGPSSEPSISDDGRFVVFSSTASDLVAGDTNGARDVFLRDRNLGTTVRVSVRTGGGQADLGGQTGEISPDGRFVGIASYATDLVPLDLNGRLDVFVHNVLEVTTQLASVATDGTQGNQDSESPALSANGRFVAFQSLASNLVAGDTNGLRDAFVRDRNAAGFSSLCSPGLAGVIACPCSNPPAGPGRGCDNSSATGGAILFASGQAYLASDTLVFTTSGEKPTALSIVTQWLGTSASGIAFGMGVRCTSGTFKRLYNKTAVGGSITAPAGGDPAVSVRSAALGDTILPGQSRWYLVHYRDPVVLGGCSPTSNFNATQTGRVVWSP